MMALSFRTAVANTVVVMLFSIVSACGWSDPPQHPKIRPAPIGSPGWTVTRRYTAHHVLIVDVETPDQSRAVDIAREIVEPVKQAYGEALVYVRVPGDASRTRRVQWTAKDGYRILDY